MVMRVGGIVSGMDIESMVNKLMEAERTPLNKMYQQRTLLTWKRDAFREINNKLLELDNLMLDMKLSKTYHPKAALSSQEKSVTATATSSASNGTYEIKVTQLATSAMNIGESLQNIDLDTVIGESRSGVYEFQTYNEAGEAVQHSFEINEDDTLRQVLRKIENASEGTVRAFYDESEKRVVLEMKRTGSYHENGNEITFEGNDFFTDVLKLSDNEIGGQNAQFIYNNGLTIESKNNTYTLNGITFQFHNVTEGNARISVTTDVDTSFDAIMNFVNKYNEAIELMNKSQTEEKYRDFPPLTDEQKAEMSEDQIKKWEEKAKSGILRGESTIRDGMYTLRQSLQSSVDTGGEYKLLSQIGITTTRNYHDGGKLQVDEEKLKAALHDNPEDVYKLFSNSEEGSSRGLIHRFDDALDQTRARIERQAGNSTHTLDNYTLGKRMKELNERISEFEKRMVRVEQRYWSQFTRMEKAIASLSQQSDYLFSQFGGGM